MLVVNWDICLSIFFPSNMHKIHFTFYRKIGSVQKRNYFWSDIVEESSKIKFSVFTLLCQVDKIELKSCHFLKVSRCLSNRTVLSSNPIKCIENILNSIFHLLSYSIEYTAKKKKIHKLRKISSLSSPDTSKDGIITWQLFKVLQISFMFTYFEAHASLKTFCRIESLSVKITQNLRINTATQNVLPCAQRHLQFFEGCHKVVHMHTIMLKTIKFSASWSQCISGKN